MKYFKTVNPSNPIVTPYGKIKWQTASLNVFEKVGVAELRDDVGAWLAANLPKPVTEIDQAEYNELLKKKVSELGPHTFTVSRVPSPPQPAQPQNHAVPVVVVEDPVRLRKVSI